LEALEMAEKLRSTVESMRFIGNESVSAIDSPNSAGMDGCFTVTVSIGITEEQPAVAHSQSGLDLLDQADRALYTAKESGRNCCVLYQPPSPDTAAA
ncbi:MAG: diguanylate cyclase, partial [Pseudomonadota bacterium]